MPGLGRLSRVTEWASTSITADPVVLGNGPACHRKLAPITEGSTIRSRASAGGPVQVGWPRRHLPMTPPVRRTPLATFASLLLGSAAASRREQDPTDHHAPTTSSTRLTDTSSRTVTVPGESTTRTTAPRS